MPFISTGPENPHAGITTPIRQAPDGRAGTGELGHDVGSR